MTNTANEAARNRRCTIADLAKGLDLSVGTVSMALSGNPSVKEETRERVILAARKANYRPNLQARSLRTQKTKRVGVIISDLNNPLYIEKVNGARDVLSREGYDLVFECSGWDLDAEKHACSHFLAQQVDAMIICCLAGRAIDHIVSFRKTGRPVCIISELLPAPDDISVIYATLHDGYYRAARLLLELGHRRLLLLGIDEQRHKRRLSGVQRALAETNTDAEVMVTPACGSSPRIGYEAMTYALNENTRESLPTAVLALNDMVALGAISALSQNGLSVPQDMSVVGCDNINLSAYTSPPLTTISQDPYRLGCLAAQAVLEELKQGKPAQRRREEPMELVLRSSTGLAPKRMELQAVSAGL
jgi:LacI family transcriptional regulator